jgi:hypothetical protein
VAKKWYNFFVVTEPAPEAGAGGTTTPAGKGGPAAAAPVKGAPSKDSAPPSAAKPPAPKGGAPAPPTRVADLPIQSAPEPVFEAPVADPTAFLDIYDAARIPAPPHGYTILKVADMLKSEHLRDLPQDVRRKSILVALDAAGVPVTEIVEDAVQRDRALDAYERVLEKTVEELRTKTAEENRRLEDEVNRQLAQLKAQIEENGRLLREEEQNLTSWRGGKLREEARIAEAVSYFVSENPVTTGAPPARNGGDDVR